MSRCQFFKEYSLRNRRPSKNEDRVVMKIAFKKRVLQKCKCWYNVLHVFSKKKYETRMGFKTLK